MTRSGNHRDGITTVVVVMLGRGSYDRVLGARALIERLPGDGLTAGMSNPNLDGDQIAVYQAFESSPARPPTGKDAVRCQSNGGRNDGFVVTHQTAHRGQAETEPMSYLVRSQLPVTWALADAYASCDRWFACEEEAAWWQSFERSGVPWAMYRPEGLAGYLEAAALGSLHPVSLIDATDESEMEIGQDLMRSIYGALATSAQWSNSLLVISCIDHGGFFDHVARLDACGGFRVPTIVAGPFARAGHVSSEQHDHWRFARDIANELAAGPLTRAGGPLADCLDLARLAEGRPAPPISLAQTTPQRSRQGITAPASGCHDRFASSHLQGGGSHADQHDDQGLSF
jgi:phospholipase C